MSRRTYPRFGSARNIQKKQERRPPKDKKTCAICGAEATHEVWIEVSWFRGDDELAGYACKEHCEDPSFLRMARAA